MRTEVRNTTHALNDMGVPKRERERRVFERFVRSLPEFAGETIQKWSQPLDEKDFPDVTCISSSGKQIGVELGEWFEEKELKTIKGMERVEDSILKAIGDQGENFTKNIYRVSLQRKTKVGMKPKDKDNFRHQIFQCIAEVDKRWAAEWSLSPESYKAKGEDLKTYPLLVKYLDAMLFFPRAWYSESPPTGCDWITFRARGGWFTEQTMLTALRDLLAKKREHYGSSGMGFDRLCLIAYYDSAWLYNSPAEIASFKFEHVAQAVRNRFILRDGSPFNDIFLFVAASGRAFRIV